jgi:hypothetical protein
MNPSLRHLVRALTWLTLACCFLADGYLGEAAIFSGDRISVDERGNWLAEGPQTHLWLPIAGFLILQGILIFAAIRLRDPKSSHVLHN